MEINPQRVRSAEFKTVRKGADPDEVKTFLSDVADELERAQNQSTAMEARARAAVARLQDMEGESAPKADLPSVDPGVPVEATVDEAETISRTMLLAQRTADTAVAEARAESARILMKANDEAAGTLDSTREMSAQLLAEARDDARKAGENERLELAGEVDALKARRDFLESDVDQLETFLVDQRTRIRDAATSLVDVVERVPAGLGAARPPLLSASDDATETFSSDFVADALDAGQEGSSGDAAVEQAATEPVTVERDARNNATEQGEGSTAAEDLVILTELAEAEDEQRPDNEDFRFSFDDTNS